MSKKKAKVKAKAKIKVKVKTPVRAKTVEDNRIITRKELDMAISHMVTAMLDEMSVGDYHPITYDEFLEKIHSVAGEGTKRAVPCAVAALRLLASQLIEQ